MKWESSSRVGGEFDGRWLAFLQYLIDAESVDLESVVVVKRRDDQFDVLSLPHGDDSWVVFIVLGRHHDFSRVLAYSGARSCVLREGFPSRVM